MGYGGGVTYFTVTAGGRQITFCVNTIAVEMAGMTTGTECTFYFTVSVVGTQVTFCASTVAREVAGMTCRITYCSSHRCLKNAGLCLTLLMNTS